MKNAWLAVLALIATQASTVASQSPADVQRVATGEYAAPLDAIATYGRYFHRGLRDSLSIALRRDLSTVTWDAAAPDLTQSFIVVSLIAAPITETKPAVVHLLLPPSGPALKAPYRLPGKHDLYEVFISLDDKAQYASSWVSTPEAPPQQAQLIKLAETAFSPLATVLEAWINPMWAVPTTDISRVAHHVVVNRVLLPDRRALVKVTSSVSGGVPMLAKGIVESAQATRIELSRSSARVSPCAMASNDLLSGSVARAAIAIGPVITREERLIIASGLNADVRSQLETPECRSEASGSNAEARTNATATVAARYMGIISPPSDPVVGTTEIRNIPSQRISFGLIGGVMLSRSGDQHFELTDNVIGAKPHTGAITAAVVHVHPIAFDPTLPNASMAERISLFGGITTTPAAGFAGGVTLRFFRGLGVQVSHTWLRANKLKPGFQSGESPEAGARPFRLGFSNSYSLGISYEFK